MELMYKVEWPGSLNEVSFGHSGKFKCAWSSLNLVAFTSEKFEKGHLIPLLNIVNPNLCWDIFSVPYSHGQISCLEWNHSGKKLLVTDVKGNCSVWTMVDMMSNNWTSLTTFDKANQRLLNEEIVAAAWLHCGTRVPFKAEVTGLLASTFKPSLTKFGRKPVDGYLVVTSSGRILFHIIEQLYEQTLVAQLVVPCHQELADISFTKDGQIKIIMCSGKIRELIHTFDVKLTLDIQKRVSVSLEVGACIALQCAENKDCQYTFVSHIKFVTRENYDHILVCVSCAGSSMFESWLLRQRQQDTQVPLAFQQDVAAYPPEVLYHWKFVTSSHDMSRVKSFSTQTLAVNTSSSETKLAQKNKFYCGYCIAVACADNNIHVLHKMNLRDLVPIKSMANGKAASQYSNSPKRRKNANNPQATSALQQVLFSPMSCALLAFEDDGTASLFRVPPWLDQCGSALNPYGEQQIGQITQLLRHCLKTGCEWWDILLNIDPHIVDSVVKMLTAEVSSLNIATQQAYQTKIDSMNITLHQILHSPVCTDLHFQLMLRAITLVFRSLILPQKRVNSEENDPAKKLENISQTSMEKDVDKMVHNLDADPHSLQSMQPLIQWVADIVLYVLASVPYHVHNNRPGYTLLRNTTFLAMLRENLVLIRVWGLLKQACMPLFTKKDAEFDVISRSFELVTTMWQECHEDTSSNHVVVFSNSLMSDCALLPLQVNIQPLVPVTPPNSVIYHLLVRPKPLTFNFDKPEMDSQLNVKKQTQLDYIQPLSGQTGKMDMLRWVALGTLNTYPLKQCTRCGVVSLMDSPLKPPVKVWEQRFVNNCLCGGVWRKKSKEDVSIL